MSTSAIYFSTPTRKVTERSTMVVTARFRDRATNTDVTPTTVHYRIDACGLITDWTSVTPANPVTITITPEENRIENDARGLEKRVLTVCTDRNLATQFIETLLFEVRNIPLFDTV